MSDLPAGMAARLRRRRLQAGRAKALARLGERASSATGPGMEFADHRQYHPGDDLRHLDRHAYARFRQPYVKTFATSRGLEVTVLVDRSASMGFGDPQKISIAKQLAAGIALVALNGGDSVRFGSFHGANLIGLGGTLTGAGRSSTVSAQLVGDLGGDGPTDLVSIAKRLDRRIPAGSLLVVISDWWTHDPRAAVRAFGTRGRELVAVHVLSPEEEDPAATTSGATVLEDAETGDTVVLNLDSSAVESYELALAAWRAQIREAVAAVRGRYLPVSSSASVEQVLLQDWRVRGFIE